MGPKGGGWAELGGGGIHFVNKKGGILGSDLAQAGFDLVFLSYRHLLQNLGDFQIGSTFLNLCVQGHELGDF